MRRNHNLVIRVTKEEKEDFKRKARDLGFDNVAGFVRWYTKEKIFRMEKIQKSLSGLKD